MTTTLDRYHVKIYQGLDGFTQLRVPWHSLLHTMENKGFWHYYEWYESYLRHLEPEPEKIYFVAVSDQHNVVAIMPFKYIRTKYKGIPLNVLELPRHSHIKLKDILFPDAFRHKKAMGQVLSVLRKSRLPAWDVMLMHDLLPESGALTAFGESSPLTIIEPHDCCNFIEIGASEESMKVRMGKHLKKNLRKANKMAQALGQLTNVTVNRPEQLSSVFHTFLDLEASGWKGPRGTRTAIQCDPQLIRFYGSLVEKFGKHGACEISLLRLNDQPIAGSFALVVSNTAYSLKIAYEQKMAELSPGNLHREKLIYDYSRRPDIQTFNLVSGNTAPWHQRWNVSSLPTHRLFLYNRTPGALLAYLLKKIRKRLPNVQQACAKDREVAAENSNRN